MNKLLQTMLVSAVMVTSGVAAQELAGFHVIPDGGTVHIKKIDHTLTGAMTFVGSNTKGQGAELKIADKKTLDVKGGTLGIQKSTLRNFHCPPHGTTNKPQIEIKGTLKFSPKDSSNYPTVDLSGVQINILKGGTIDMSPLRKCEGEVKDRIEVLDLSGNISNIVPNTPDLKAFNTVASSLNPAKALLPFNCKFSNIDLRDVDSVEYTRLRVGRSSNITIDNNTIMKVITGEEKIYGDYRSEDLGVTLPECCCKTKVSEIKVDGDLVPMTLSGLATNKETYNKSEYKLKTCDLDNVTDNISTDTTYNFGFIGRKPISVQSAGIQKAIFAGDNSEYNPSGVLKLTKTVEFAGDNSLFPITQTYGQGIFSGECQNEIPADKEVTFNSGITVNQGHRITVKGVLNI